MAKSNTRSKVSSLKQATGALPSDSRGAKGATKGETAAAPNSGPILRQTDGSYMPITGPITNVHQLIKSKTVSKGSPGSFNTLAEYTTYLKNLTTAELHRHALEEMRMAPIDDNDKLIRRLEAEWTNNAHRLAGDTQGRQIPVRKPFSPEQLAAQEALRRKMLGR